MAAGQQIEIGHWSELKDIALPLRMSVFVHEQGVPAELEHDEFDEQASHVVVLDSYQQVIATGRLLVISPTIGKIGRLAVSKPFRGQGYGRAALLALIEQAKALGVATVKLHAQCDAEAFYEGLGFVAQGPRFIEAGIEHVLMSKDVS